MEECENEINDIDEVNRSFLKCIEIPNGLLAIYEGGNKSFYVWNKYAFLNDEIYIIEYEINDLLLINSNYIKYFILTHNTNRTISFYNINNLNEKKVINNININSESNCNISFNNNYLLINCKNGLAVISIKYQELIQYYEYKNTIEEYSCIKIDEKNNFYYLYNHESSNNSGYAYLICGRIEKDCITVFKNISKNIKKK